MSSRPRPYWGQLATSTRPIHLSMGNASSYCHVSLRPFPWLACGLTRILSCTTIDGVSSLTRLCVGKERPTQRYILLQKRKKDTGRILQTVKAKNDQHSKNSAS